MRKFLIMISVLLIALIATSSIAANNFGNKRKGKYLYRKVYKTCMDRGEMKSPKPILDPDSKKMAEWTQVFSEKKFDEFKCTKEWSNLTDTDAKDIYTYLYSFAADSPTPAKCK